MPIRFRWFALPILLSLLLASCGGGSPSASGGSDSGGEPAAPALALAVAGMPGLTAATPTLVSSTRVGRTTFDYTYTVLATNGGAQALLNVSGTVSSEAATTVVTDGTLSFGDLAPGAAATSSDTFTIRQDRNAPLASANLTITLSGTLTGSGAAEGVPLGGQPQERALDRLVSQAPIPARPEDESGSFLLSRLDVTLAPDATVGEVNAALAAIGGGIAGMEPGFDTVVVAVPRQADADALRALAVALGEEPGILFAFPGRSSPDRAAPPAPANTGAQIRHLQDARFLPAWNARAAAGNCTDNRVVVVVPDTYLQGNGATFAANYADFDGQVPGVPAVTQFAGSTIENFHGYNVLVTMAARADARPPAGAMPFSECLDLRPLQRKRLTDTGLLQSITQTALEIVAQAPQAGNFIVSHAWGFPSCVVETCNPGVAAELARELPVALQMAQAGVGYRLMLSRFRERMLTISAGGNERIEPVTQIYPGIGLAEYDSPMNIAARSDATMSWIRNTTQWDPDDAQFPCTDVFCPPSMTATAPEQADFEAWLRASGRDQDPPAANVLIVGSADFRVNGVNSTSDFSDAGADVEAIGRDLPTLPGGTVNGTSFASPQVSGLAAYLWLLSPELRSRPVMDTINAIKANICRIGCAGVIDAYATVLALDSGRALATATSRIRMAILDADVDPNVDADLRFTEADLSLFVQALRPGGVAQEPSARDDSRYDLNGDGYTGGSRRAPFDLDPGDSPPFGQPVLKVAPVVIQGASINYDENRVTDLEILCYYAYSPLFSGDESARSTILTGLCGRLTITPKNAVLQPGGSRQFSVNVSGTASSAVSWTLPDGGGIIGATNGLFQAGNSHGVFRVRAASTAEPSISDTALVFVGTPRSWAGTVQIARRSTSAENIDYPPGTTPGADGYLFLGGSLSESNVEDLSASVAIEIILERSPGTAEDLTVGSVSGTFTQEFMRRSALSYSYPSYGCTYDRSFGLEYSASGADNASVNSFAPFRLSLQDDGSYTLYVGSVSMEAPIANSREYDITVDADPDDETPCITLGNYDGPVSSFSRVAGISSPVEVSGTIADGQISGSNIAETAITSPNDGSSIGTETFTVTWSLQPRCPPFSPACAEQ